MRQFHDCFVSIWHLNDPLAVGPEFCTPNKKRHHQIHIRTPQHCKWSLFPQCIYFLEIFVILPLVLLVNAGLRSVRSIFHDCSCWSSACAELCSVIYSLFIFVAIVAWTNYFLSLKCVGIAFDNCLFYRRSFFWRSDLSMDVGSSALLPSKAQGSFARGRKGWTVNWCTSFIHVWRSRCKVAAATNEITFLSMLACPLNSPDNSSGSQMELCVSEEVWEERRKGVSAKKSALLWV